MRQRLTCHDDRDPGHVSIRGQRHLVWIRLPCILEYGGHGPREERVEEHVASAFVIYDQVVYNEVAARYEE